MTSCVHMYVIYVQQSRFMFMYMYVCVHVCMYVPYLVSGTFSAGTKTKLSTCIYLSTIFIYDI